MRTVVLTALPKTGNAADETTIVAVGGTGRGKQRPWAMAPVDQLVTAGLVREDLHYFDSAAVTGLQLVSEEPEGTNYKVLDVWTGESGSWSPRFSACEAGDAVCGARVQVDPGTIDDEGILAIRLECCRLSTGARRYELLLNRDHDDAPKIRDLVMCPPNTFVVGARVRADDFCGYTFLCDDEGITTLEIRCLAAPVHCQAGSFQSVAPTVTSTRKCAACPVGKFTIRQDAPSCISHISVCPPGTRLLAMPTNFHRVFCQLCLPGETKVSARAITP